NEFWDYLLNQTRHFGPRDGFGHLEFAHNFAPKQAKMDADGEDKKLRTRSGGTNAHVDSTAQELSHCCRCCHPQRLQIGFTSRSQAGCLRGCTKLRLLGTCRDTLLEGSVHWLYFWVVVAAEEEEEEEDQINIFNACYNIYKQNKQPRFQKLLQKAIIA
ncbi:hypothetical protein JRQ81_012717, partial [Phrynocephalus forsythii]